MKYFFILCFLSNFIYAQIDSVNSTVKKNPVNIDSLKLTVDGVLLSGNDITDDDIIIREMSLKKGSRFTVGKYEKDLLSIYNLGLFTKVDIFPVPSKEKSVLLNVDVQERWYILPLPQAGIEDGEWAKKWIAIKLRWDNFRGRNESLNIYGRVLYNPSVSFSYSIPWIGEKLHLFTSFGIGYSKIRNKSLTALGRSNTGNTLTSNDSNYDNFNFNVNATIGKYITKNFNTFINFGYYRVRVSQYQPGRTVDNDGNDNYLGYGFGVSYDTRNILEYPTRGIYTRTVFMRYGQIDDALNFGRFDFESQTFLPVDLSKNYFLTIATKFRTSLAVGAVIPVYQHQYLGYSEEYVRGWKGKAFEGEDIFTVWNELRIPILQPKYISAKDIPIVKDVPIIKKLDLRHGLFFTLIYDLGTVFNTNDKIKKVRFLNGAGFGLDFIMPFGYIARIDWVFRLGKPTVGQIGFHLGAKF